MKQGIRSLSTDQVKGIFSKIDELIREAIITALRMEGVCKEVIEAFMEKAGDITFSKTASRSMVAKMNNAVREIEFM
jgi:ethanolamine utilization protein EutQ (cupin superfamily)